MIDASNLGVGGAGRTKPRRPLTHRALVALQPESAPYRVPDSRCGGLAVRVAVDGSLTFDLAFRVKGGTSRRLSLGRFPDVSLDEARDRANELTRAGRAGRDLIREEEATRDAEAKRLTIAALIDEYLAKVVIGKLRTAKEMESRLRRTLAPKLSLPIDSIRRRDLRELFDEVAEAGFMREAEKRRQTIRAMFRWALSRDLLLADPTAGLAGYDPGTPRDRVLSDEEIKNLWRWLDEGKFPPDHTQVLRLQLLTGARCGEVAGIAGAEIDATSWMWTLPAARSKNNRPRVTPIVGIARDILSQRLPSETNLFKSESGLSLKTNHVGSALISWRHRIPVEHFNTHDLRRTFATALDAMGVSIDLIAAILGHEAVTSRETRTLVRHYLRTDKIEKKKSALEAWDKRVKRLVT